MQTAAFTSLNSLVHLFQYKHVAFGPIEALGVQNSLLVDGQSIRQFSDWGMDVPFWSKAKTNTQAVLDYFEFFWVKLVATRHNFPHAFLKVGIVVAVYLER